MPEHADQFQKGELVPGTAYRVEELIGSGGMGRVYRVEHAELGRRFVLKALHGHLASRPDLVARLKNEWRALGKLEHPNIVQVTDAGQTERGLPFYVMEHLRGKTLGQLLMEQKRLSAREACLLVVDILAGLHAAHQTGAVHRDIKPPNIFIVEGGRAKLLDFGIAKLRDQSAKVVTAGGISIGTPRYMAPEQASGTVVDGRADIYATALVLYEMVVGKGPFSHIRDPNELVMAHIGQEPERADFREPRVPPELGDLIARWLSKSPHSRPATAEFARRELLALAESLPSEHVTTVNEEVTVAGAYEASTLGVLGSVSEKANPSVERASASAAFPARESPVWPGETPAGSETQAIATVTVGTGEIAAEPGARSSGPFGRRASVPGRIEDSGLGRAEVLESRRLSSPTGLRARRSSVTPPPVSTPRPGSVEASRTTLKWIVGTAVLSFLLAWGISLLLKASEAERAKGSEAASTLPGAALLEDSGGALRRERTLPMEAAEPPLPKRESAGAASEAAAVSNMAPSGGTTVSSRAGPKDSVAGEKGAAPAPGAAAQGAAGPVPRHSAENGTVATVPSSAPSRPVKKQAAKVQLAPPADPGEQLPESGLW